MEFANYSELYLSSDYLQSKLSPENYRLYSPVAELVKQSATRDDVSFDDLKQADLVALMISFINPSIFGTRKCCCIPGTMRNILYLQEQYSIEDSEYCSYYRNR
ncbi:hypothetical protein HYO67_gp10 [Escherichia phage 500465-1]|uniref:hypothetical protein n=1 Tax=Escherichia phage 500465-1 TaxID=2716351 RepID=UPI0018AD260D|nr:hypothetical protein HYO67_gp10 [Escherichia phage 500465-1]